MADDDNVLRHELTPTFALQLIRRIAENSARVFMTRHATKRMAERQITVPQVRKCLLVGTISEGPYRDVKGNWKVQIEALTAGDVVVVEAALDYDEEGNQIIVITAYRR